MNALPLITGLGLDDVFAWLPAGPRRVRDFLADTEALAARLPAGRALLNVCHDRYRFAVGFAAGLVSGKVSLQPASQSAETLVRIRADFPDVVCLCDGDFDTLGLPRCDFPDLSTADPQKLAEIPRIPADRLAAILFTSGSTGLPQPHRKTWGRLVANGRAEAAALGLDRTPHTLVGTVPVQHSYGFESTFLLALHGGCAFWSGKPFYPQDIAAALDAVPRPRLLVTTPFHLSTLLASGIDLPAIDQLLSATAPLSAALAAEAEARTGAPLHEIYGSTESGQLASRRTTDGATWTLLPGVRLEQDADCTTACDGHVEGRVALSDVIELLPERRFLLHGRHADLINIAA
jgi:acyl-coenzyme A synthetase/AMP-(fatty) acid ligase